MALLTNSKVSAALKKILNKAHTDASKEHFNEAKPSFVQAAAQFVLGEPIPQAPSNASLYDITGSVEFVRLELVEDPTSNGHGFFAQLPPDYESVSSNPRKGTGDFVNGRRLVDTFGALQIVPIIFGVIYEPKPFRNGTSSQASGELISPGDPVDWFIDTANGVFWQENDPDISPDPPSHVECFLYIGEMLTGSGGGGATSGILGQAAASISSTQLIDSVLASQASTIKWIIEVTDSASSKRVATEILASKLGNEVNHQTYAWIEQGNPNPTFIDFDVILTGTGPSQVINLLGTTDETNVQVKVTRILVF